jgi:hypothetical protein
MGAHMQGRRRKLQIAELRKLYFSLDIFKIEKAGDDTFGV